MSEKILICALVACVLVMSGVLLLNTPFLQNITCRVLSVEHEHVTFPCNDVTRISYQVGVNTEHIVLYGTYNFDIGTVYTFKVTWTLSGYYSLDSVEVVK